MLINTETIIHDDNPIMREHSAPVSLPLSDEDRDTLQSMLEYVRNSQIPEKAEELSLQPAVGIAAIQLGIPKQMIAVVVPDGEEKVEYALVNPKIVSHSVQKGYLEGGEGCLSVPELHEGYVVRSARIKVKGYDLITDQEVSLRASGYLAMVLQHEIDHLSGILYYDHINEEDPFEEIEGAVVIE